MSKNILYLGSQSKPRQKLIEMAGITYKILKHDSDECVVKADLSFEKYVQAIAEEKMKHVVFPSDLEKHSPIFVLTADTLVFLPKTGDVLSKPNDMQDAKRMLRLLRDEVVEVVTACCIEKKKFDGKKWVTVAKEIILTNTEAEFNLEEEDFDLYFSKMPQALNACSGGIIEGYGQNFLKSVRGSYTSVLGLPIYEVRLALKKLGFWK